MFCQIGRELDQSNVSSSLDLYPIRNYNPTLGRFTSKDTFDGHPTKPLSLNKYNYCLSDPTNMVDPSGHDPVELLANIAIGYTIAVLSGQAVAAIATRFLFGNSLTANIGYLYGTRASLGAFLFPQAITRILDNGYFDDDGTVATATSSFRHRWMYEYATAHGLVNDGQWHSIDVDTPVNTYENLIDGNDVPTVPSFLIGGLYSLNTRGTFDAKIEANGTASFKNVNLKWLATDKTDAHTYSEAIRTGSDFYSAAAEGTVHFLGDGLAGASFDLFIYFADHQDVTSVPRGHQWNY